MSSAELILLVQKRDPAARKQIFSEYYGVLSGIAQRYSKSSSQAEDMLTVALNNCFHKLETLPDAQIELGEFLEKEFIRECIAFIRNIRSEYFVASTVYATPPASKKYDLFDNDERLDFNGVDAETLLTALQQLVPAQRLIFNLHVIDGYTLDEAAALLEASAPTVKSNLEKARFSMQKNIEKSIKNIKS